ncbi:MAG: GNAT family N-acetyltransferase [Planctomycetes bacterium]|nr:GNAT family N-acetyltransferase [Planctomycetota bacterium]
MDSRTQPSAGREAAGSVGAERREPVALRANAAPAACAPPQFTAAIVDDVAAFERFEEFHRAHHAHPESHFDLLRAALRHGRQAQPFCVQVARNGEPCLLMVGQMVRGRLRWRLGYRTLHASNARTVEVLQGGWLGDLTPPALAFLYDFLCDFLRRGGADAIHLRHVPATSEVHAVFGPRPSWLWRDRSPSSHTNWRLQLPTCFAAWQAAQSKREREDTKRYDKRIRKEYGGAVRVEVLETAADIDRVAEVVESIARKTYQRGLGAGFRDAPETRARWAAGAADGALDVRVLWFGDQPVAFCTGFVFGGTLWLEHLGYDPAFRRFRPGMFLLLRLIEELTPRADVQAIDFGIGDADYKRRLCDQSRVDVSRYVFAPTLRGLWLNTLRGTANGLSRCAEACLARIGLLEWLKSRWRRALQPREAGRDDE